VDWHPPGTKLASIRQTPKVAILWVRFSTRERVRQIRTKLTNLMMSS